MRITAFVAIVLASLALSACYPRYYYDDRYDRYGDRYNSRYYGSPTGYDRYNGPYNDRDRYYDRRDRY